MRPFPHVVTMATDSRQEVIRWCVDQFGPSEATLTYFNRTGTGMYNGDGEWSVGITRARFERIDHAMAFKLRWG